MSWPTAKLGTLGEFRNGLNYSKANFGAGLKVVNVKDFGNRSIPDLSIVEEINPAGLSVEKALLQRNDIIFVRSNGNKDLLGRSLRIDRDYENLSFSGFCIRFRATKSDADPVFLSYFFRTPTFRRSVSLFGKGTNINNLNQDIMQALDVPVPPRLEQQCVVDILSAYDDLIENNRRRMALLEEAARQLYREWFVRLRFPGHEHTRITNGVPEGWERRSVDRLTTLLNRGIAPQYDDEADGLVINQKCIRGGRLNLSLARHQSREFKPERQVRRGDVLVNSTGEGTLGRVAQVLAPIANCTVDTHVTIVRPKPESGIHYFGQALMEWEPRFSTMGRGATNQTELSRSQIGEVEVLVPSRTLVQQFEGFSDPLFRQVATLMEQNERLRAARDLLLPRLMSGEIAV
jgi:type I restriction enzyme, S subunit